MIPVSFTMPSFIQETLDYIHQFSYLSNAMFPLPPTRQDDDLQPLDFTFETHNVFIAVLDPGTMGQLAVA